MSVRGLSLSADSGQQGRLYEPALHRTVLASQVHKNDPAEVLITSAIRFEGSRFGVATLWPSHGRGQISTPQGAPLLLAEAMRQTSIYLSHQFYDVPEGHQFILSRLDLNLDGPRSEAPAWNQSAQLDVEVEVITATPRQFTAELHALAYHGSEVLGRGVLRWSAFKPTTYARVRSRSAGADMPFPETGRTNTVLAAESVGCRSSADVLLGGPRADETQSAWPLILDTGHPTYFDHPVDHVPGMVILEAFRQAGYALLNRPAQQDRPTLTGVSSNFSAFAAFDSPIQIATRAVHDAQQDSHRLLDALAIQDGRTVARARGTWTCGQELT